MSTPVIAATAAVAKGAVDAAAKKKKEKENEKFKMRKAARRTARTLSPKQETRARRQRGKRRAERFPGLSRAEVSAKRAEKGKGKSAPSTSETPTKTLKPGARQRKTNRIKKGIGRYAK